MPLIPGSPAASPSTTPISVLSNPTVRPSIRANAALEALADPELGGAADRVAKRVLARRSAALAEPADSAEAEEPRISPIPIYIGIDPGGAGGLAAISGASGAVISCAMPEEPADLLAWLRRLVAPGETAPCAILELVGGHAATEEGKDGLPGSRMFTFGENYGLVQGMLIALEIPFQRVRPQEWQKVYCTRKRQRGKKGVAGEKRGAWKNYLKGLAQNLFPEEKVTLSTCDALLLADLCRRWHSST